jgi:hypothetical protein
MHKLSSDDPAPDSSDYQNDVWCEHNALAVHGANRRQISEQVSCQLPEFLRESLPYVSGSGFPENLISLLGSDEWRC